MLSEVFLELYTKKARSFDEKYNGLNWIYKIIKHKAFAINKKDGVFVEYPDDNLMPRDLISEEGFDEYQYLQHALSQLSDTENRILRLKLWEGLTIREIAKELNMKHTTVFYQYNAILKKLAEYLNKTDKE